MIKRHHQLHEDHDRDPPSEIQNLLKPSSPSSPTYSSLADQAEQPIDYETLLTLALESTSREAVRKSKRRQGILVSVIFILVIMMGILVTYSVREYPEQKQLHDEIDSLESDIKKMESDAELDALRRDVEDKKNHIIVLDHDPDIDDETRDKLIKETEQDIDELEKLIAEQEQERKQELEQEQDNNEDEKHFRHF